MRIAIDLDNTLCPTSKTKLYEEIIPYPQGVRALQKWKAQGHTIIIFTARHQGFYEGHTGKILGNLGYLYEWFEKWKIPVDELYLKPLAACYLDDRSITHTDWDTSEQLIDEKIQNDE